MVAPIPSLLRSPALSNLQLGKIQKIEGLALNRYLSDFSLEDKRQARELWYRYALQKELIDFEANTPGSWVRGRRQYGFRDGVYFERLPNGTEKVIPPSVIRLNIDKFTIEIRNVQRQMMTDMINGKISPQTWYDESMRLMKLSYLATVMIAQGESTDFDSQEMNRWLLLILAFFLLHNLLVDGILNGKIPINGRLPIYAGLRGAWITSIYEDFRLKEMIDLGMEGRRVLSIAEHCEPSEGKHGCVELANLGYMPASQIIPIGEGTTCGKYCKCTIEYRRPTYVSPL